MKKTINVIVIEDNENYNNMLSNAIQQSINQFLLKGSYQLVMRSFTDANDFIRKIKLGKLECRDSIIFMDYYLGDGINAGHITKILKEINVDTTIVLLSQSKAVSEKSNMLPYDFFVVKDYLAPALCCMYMRQFIENKFCVTLG